MEGRRQDVVNTNEVQVVPEGPGDVAGTVIREQFGTVFDRYIGHDGSVHRFLNHLDQGVSRHIFLQLLGQDETGVVVHHGHQVIIAPANHPEVGGVGGPHLVRPCGFGVVFLPCHKLYLLAFHQPFPSQDTIHRGLVACPPKRSPVYGERITMIAGLNLRL